MRRTTHRAATALPVALAAGLLMAACGGSTGPEGPFTLVFSGDASFHVTDGGNMLHLAVLLVSPDTMTQDSVMARDSTIVSALADPSFSFTIPDLLEAGTAYAVDYWIDSNGNGRCDAPPVDHQWSESLGRITGAINRTVSFDAGAMTDVCATFVPDTTALP
ncbi:MAG: hypothetical protein P8174_00720 [Gemmatimonadota bacterium]